MVLKADQQRVKALLAETITLLCKNGLHFKSELSIEGLIGITLDEEEIFLVSIKETIRSKDSAPAVADDDDDNDEDQQQQSSLLQQSNKRTRNRTAVKSPATVLPSSNKSKIISKFPPNNSSNNSRTSRFQNQGSPSQSSVPSSRSNDVLPSDIISSTVISSDSATVVDNNSFVVAATMTSFKEHGDSAIASFPNVAVKLNDVHSEDDKIATMTNDEILDEPANKRLRITRIVRNCSEISNETNVYSSNATETAKTEPLDVIEIKEESLSDGEEGQMTEYSSSAYDNFNSSAMYGNSSAVDMSQSFGEASMFQAGGSGFFSQQQDEGETMADNPLGLDRQQQHYQQMQSLSFSDFLQETTQQQMQEDNGENALSLTENLNDRRFPCACMLCGKFITSKDGLRCHMVNWHNMPKNINCEFCDETFGYRRALRRHIIACHPDTLPAVVQS